MIHGHQAYRRRAHLNWTRVDMLLAVYDGVLASIDAGLGALQRGAQQSYPHCQLRTSQLILLLVDGLNVEQDETAGKIHSLCLFCLAQISTPEEESWRQARDVLETLRAAFQGIQQEARELEAAGTIAALAYDDGWTLARS